MFIRRDGSVQGPLQPQYARKGIYSCAHITYLLKSRKCMEEEVATMHIGNREVKKTTCLRDGSVQDNLRTSLKSKQYTPIPGWGKSDPLHWPLRYAWREVGVDTAHMTNKAPRWAVTIGGMTEEGQTEGRRDRGGGLNLIPFIITIVTLLHNHHSHFTSVCTCLRHHNDVFFFLSIWSDTSKFVWHLRSLQRGEGRREEKDNDKRRGRRHVQHFWGLAKQWMGYRTPPFQLWKKIRQLHNFVK